MATTGGSLRKKKGKKPSINLYEKGGKQVENLEQICLSIPHGIEGEKIFDFLVQCVKKINTSILHKSSPEKENIFSLLCNMRDEPIHMVRLENGSENEYILRILHACATFKKKSFSSDVEQMVKEYLPIKIEYKNEEIYTFLNASIKKNYHRKKWKIAGEKEKHPSVWIGDFCTLYSEEVVKVGFYHFIRKHFSIIRYKVIENMMMYHASGTLYPLVLNSSFLKDLEEEKKKWHLSEHLLERKRKEEYFIHQKIPLEQLETFFYIENEESSLKTTIYLPSFLNLMMEEYLITLKNIQRHQLEKKSPSSSRASLLEMKKNIHPVIQDKMKTSHFLSHYGKVELDNDIDLHLFEKMEHDFRTFADLLPLSPCHNHIFRIRKLGLLRAEGIYYRYHKTLLLDIDHPHAYIHELGHQIDDVMANSQILLSEQISFRPLLEHYQMIVEEKVFLLCPSHPFRKRWESKRRYNRAYYFESTEVFARSFELYVFFVLKVQNKLLKEKYDTPDYPWEDETYRKMVKDYFHSLFFEPHSLK